MIESSTAITAAPREDAGYKSWETSAKRAQMRFDLNDRTAGPIPAFGTMVHETALAAQGMNHAYAPGTKAAANGAVPDIAYNGPDDDGYSFDDMLDMINPLQHLPVIGTIYRKMTGDTIKPISNIVGGALFGGPIGAVASTMNVIVKNRTGKDVAENAFSLVGLDMTPRAAAKPQITYDAPIAASADASTSQMAAANLYQTAAHSGAKNFAAHKISTQSWNT